MRFTPFSEPSDREIDAQRLPPYCPQCEEPAENYDELCQDCQDMNPHSTHPSQDQDGKDSAFTASTAELFKPPLSVLDFIALIRGSRPDSEHFFMNGGCWELFCLLRCVWPEARPYHTWTDDVTLEVGQHVATKIGDCLYDIRGRIRHPKLYTPMTTTSWPSLNAGDRPHRWAKRYVVKANGMDEERRTQGSANTTDDL